MVHDGIGGYGSQSSEIPSTVVIDMSSAGPRPRPLRAAFASYPSSSPSLVHREVRLSPAA